MSPTEALQYLSSVATDFARTLPSSAQAPFAGACNEAFRALLPLTETPEPDAMVNGDGRARESKEGQKRESPALD